MKNKTLIKLEGITKSYGSHAVLKGIDMEIREGEIYGLIGKNGAGKTTIFKMILGLSNFDEGNLSIGEGGTSLSEGRSQIGFLIGGNFFGYLDARENLAYYCRLKNIKNPKEEIERVLKIVGLDQAKGKYKGYSMGMKQRLGIANAILGNPKILILDEPVNGLDPQGIVEIRNLIKQLNSEYGMTIIVSSHILDELQSTANVFGIVHEGIIVRTVTEDELASDKQVVKVSVDELVKAVEVLQKAGIKVLGHEKETARLEDYYLKLVGENS
ncbi:MAG: ATP-binding cassette domain-containing protein [Erysipelotrichaceae bacterium]|nr:ATP-binding cassette domain-containing protein [Erysipelotrichaceae bacterium]